MSTKSENSFEIHELKNLTSDLRLLSSSEQIEILECAEQSVIFQTQKLKCSIGQLISLNGVLKLEDENVEFSVVGKISGLEVVGESHKIAIKLNQYDKAVWKKFIAAIASKQERVDSLLAAIKGDEQ